MKITWEESDIIAGMYVIRNSSPKGSKDLGFARTVTYKIGFDNQNLEKPYGHISCLTDGWYYAIGAKVDVVNWLNEDREGYRPLSKEEYINMVSSSDQGFIKI